MAELNAHAVIRDPGEELRAVFEARVKPFVELGNADKVAAYGRAYAIAQEHLAKAREFVEDHAA